MPGEYLFTGRRSSNSGLTTRQYARLLAGWIASIGLGPRFFGTHSLRRTKGDLDLSTHGQLARGPAPTGPHESREHGPISRD
jgi:hypothetical protein